MHYRFPYFWNVKRIVVTKYVQNTAKSYSKEIWFLYFPCQHSMGWNDPLTFKSTVVMDKIVSWNLTENIKIYIPSLWNTLRLLSKIKITTIGCPDESRECITCLKCIRWPHLLRNPWPFDNIHRFLLHKIKISTASPAYGVHVYISQLIRYARACSAYDQFLLRGSLLTNKLMSQGFQMSR
jgi:hypothetical protein